MKDGQVIIVKKKRGHGHGHHGGAWKVAYADFVTAMMAFFLVMWIVGQSPQVKAAIAGYFKNPGVFDGAESTGPIEGGALTLDPDSRTTGNPNEVALEDRAQLEATAARIKELLQGVPDIRGLEDQVEISVTKDGLRIELLEASDGTFFDSGSAAPKPYTERVLAVIGQELGKLKNNVIIEGHTDSRPYGSDRYTNWELSSDRANAARRVMQQSGLYAGQVQGVRGFADTHPRMPADPFNAANRRVSVIVQNLYRPDLLPESLRGAPPIDAAPGAVAAGAADEPSAEAASDPAGEDPALDRRARRRQRR
jgi:chemotaxis protein MotB